MLLSRLAIRSGRPMSAYSSTVAGFPNQDRSDQGKELSQRRSRRLYLGFYACSGSSHQCDSGNSATTASFGKLQNLLDLAKADVRCRSRDRGSDGSCPRALRASKLLVAQPQVDSREIETVRADSQRISDERAQTIKEQRRI